MPHDAALRLDEVVVDKELASAVDVNPRRRIRQIGRKWHGRPRHRAGAEKDRPLGDIKMLARADILPVRDHAFPRFRAEELEDGNVRNPLEPLLHKRLAYFRVFPERDFRRKRIEPPIRQAVDLETLNRRNDKGLAVQKGRQFRCPIGPVAEQLRALAENGQLDILSRHKIQLGAIGRPSGGQRKARDNDN